MAAEDYASKPINPQSYYVRRPYGYGYGAGYGARPGLYASAFQGGSQFGGDLVKGIADIVQAKRQQAQQAQMDTVANQLINQQLNTANAPRAALAGQGTLSNAAYQNLRQSNVNFQGTAPQTGMGGGVAELQLRLGAAKQDLANQIESAKLQAYLKALNAPPAQPQQQAGPDWHQQLQEQKVLAAQTKQFQAWQQKNGLDATKLATQFDKTYGKGSAENFYNATTQGTGVRGNIVGGNFIPDQNGDYYTYDADKAQGSPGLFGMGAHPANAADLKDSLIKYSDLQSYLDKAQQIKDAGGILYPSQYPQELMGTAPRAQLVSQPAQPAQPVNADIFGPGGQYDVTQGNGGGGGASAAANLPTPSTQDDYDALDSGSSFVDGDGQVKVKP